MVHLMLDQVYARSHAMGKNLNTEPEMGSWGGGSTVGVPYFIISKGRYVWKSRLRLKYITSGIVTSVALFLRLGIRIDCSCQVQMPVIKKSMYNFQFASS